MFPFSHSGMLPEAIIPPSEEHSYAQWLEEHDHAMPNENQENHHLKAQGKGESPWSILVDCFELGWSILMTELHRSNLASGSVFMHKGSLWPQVFYSAEEKLQKTTVI